ncbi:MAG: DUF1494 domain-containing protein [Chlamydiales bacterium]|nr:DUF1494 domain-containing protein [Chlamydiales bacterium]
MKRSFSLLEVVISLSLFAALLSSLFWWYNHLAVGRKSLSETKWPTLEKRYAYQRLDRIFKKADAPFFTTENGIVFTFDRGPHENPLLANRVLARLYHNQNEKRLDLALWPHNEVHDQTPTESFTILPHVKECSWEFYTPPEPDRKAVEREKKYGWEPTWLKADETPALIKLHIDGTTFAFDLDHQIVYPGSDI